MKIYLVIDSWQYDGGCLIEAVYLDPDKANADVFARRMELKDQNTQFKMKYNRSDDLHRENRILSIAVLELNVKE